MALEIIQLSKKTLTTRWCLILAVIGLCAGVIMYAMAYFGMVQHNGIGTLNQPILSWMISNRELYITNTAKITTTIAGPLFSLMIMSVVVAGWVIIKKEFWRPLLLAVSTAVAGATSFALKIITINGRPAQINMIAPFELDYSFPSGHTIGVTVCLLVLGYLIYSRHFSGWRYLGWIIITIFGIGIIATSRLYLGYHWLTDIVASIGLGLVIFAIVVLIDTYYVYKTKI